MDVAGLAFLHDERRILSTYVESSARSWGVGGCGRRIARSIESTPAVRCPASARHLAGSFDEISDVSRLKDSCSFFRCGQPGVGGLV